MSEFCGNGKISLYYIIVLFGILLLGLILLFRLYSVPFTNNYVRFVFYIAILFSIYVFYYFLRIYLLSRLGLHLSDLSFLILSVFPGGQAFPLPAPSGPSSFSEDSFEMK